MPTENLLQPDAVRRLAWSPPETITEESVGLVLTALGSRSWQVGLTAKPLAKALIRLATKSET